MNCRDFETALVLRVLSASDMSQRREMDEHRAGCQRCAARFAKVDQLPRFLRSDEDIPLPDPERSWAAVLERMRQRSARQHGAPWWRLAWAAAALVTVVAGGALLSPRPWSHQDPPGQPPDGGPQPSVIRTYVDRLEPVLVDFQMRGSSDAPAELLAFDRKMIVEFREDTRALLEASQRAGETDLVEILDEVDTVLVSLVHLAPGDRDAGRQLQGLIREKRQEWESRLLALDELL